MFCNVCVSILISRKLDEFTGAIEDGIKQLLDFRFALAEATWGSKGLVGPPYNPDVVGFDNTLDILRVLRFSVGIAGDGNC